MTIKTDSLQRKFSLDTPLLSLFTLNWELILYAAFFIIAVVTRFYELGARVMSHDESLHTLYSWNLYAGKGYHHDPLMHGPSLFHITALMYFLFGDNDFTARIGPALVGVAMVILPYWFRPWLGRLGSLAASFMILISPGLMYYSRYIRHDTFLDFFTLLMFLSFFQYMRTRAKRWLYIGAAAVALMLSTMEAAYIHGFIGLTFIVVAFMWENLSPANRRLVTFGLLGAMVFGIAVDLYLISQAGALASAEEDGGFKAWPVIDVVILILEMLGAAALVQLGVDRVNRPVSLTLAHLHLPALAGVGMWGGLLIWMFLNVVAGLLFLLNGLLAMAGRQTMFIFDLLSLTPQTQLIAGLLSILLWGSLLYFFGGAILQRIQPYWQIPIVRIFYGAVLLAVVIFVLLHTTFFSNIRGIYTGSFGAIDYWLRQHEVQRGGQPWYYYLFLVPMYEFLPFLVGLIGGLIYLIRGKLPAYADLSKDSAPPPLTASSPASSPHLYPSDGGLFAAFTIYWAFLAFAIYSWAGEKMPWLTVHMTLPLVFLSAHVIQTTLGRFNWREAWQKGGLILMGVLLLVIPALAALFTADPFQSQSLQSINETLQFIAAIVILMVLAGVIWNYGRRMGSGLAFCMAFVTLLFVLILLTIRFAWLLNYVNYDYVNEVLVYAHGGPDVKPALAQIDEISARTVGDKMIKIAYDNDSTWPLEWYLREYPNRAYYGENPTRETLDAPVVIVGSANETKVKPFLGDKYTRFSYRLVWWPMEDYKNQTPSRLWQTYVAGPPPENPQADTAEAQLIRRETVRQNWKNLWNILFYRYYQDYRLNEWPFVHRFYVYIRKDVLNDVWNYQSGPLPQAQAAVDPYEGKRLELQAGQVWGSKGTGESQFNTPRTIAVGPDGSIYVADTGNHRIQVFNQDGEFVLQWGSQGTGQGQFNEPWGLAVAPDGLVYVADTWNHRVQWFSSLGQYQGEFGAFANVQQGDPQAERAKFWGPRDIAIDAQGNVYVTDTGNKRVQKFSPAGEFIQAWGGGGIIPGSFEEPVGIDIDAQGNIYVADTWNRRVQKFDANFTPLAQWEVVNGWQSETVVNKPYLAVDHQGRVFISDPEGYRIIVYDTNGQLLGTWGQYGQDLASFALPNGLAFDSQGNLLVADADNNRIMKFQAPIFK